VPIRNLRRQHGRTRADYLRGCRCEECRTAESNYQRERRQAKKTTRTIKEGWSAPGFVDS
jgi:hypothetical protein